MMLILSGGKWRQEVSKVAINKEKYKKSFPWNSLRTWVNGQGGVLLSSYFVFFFFPTRRIIFRVERLKNIPSEQIIGQETRSYKLKMNIP